MKLSPKKLTLLWQKYKYQRWACERRDKRDVDGNPVRMKMSFGEWLDVWERSGHLEDRGLGAEKFVMARLNDRGHYEVGNVKICTHSENSREARMFDHGHKNGVMTPLVIDGVWFESAAKAFREKALSKWDLSFLKQAKKRMKEIA